MAVSGFEVPNVIKKAVDKFEQGENAFKKFYSKFIRVIHARDFLAECLATFILVTFGNGAIAQFILSKSQFGTFLTVGSSYGIGLMAGAYMAGGVTGAHMNPAVTLAMAMRGKTSWIKVIPYWSAQFLGAFISAAVVYGVYFDAINNFDGLQSNGIINTNCLNSNGSITPKLPLCTGGIFATYPQPQIGLGNAFFDQVLGTFLLVIAIFGIIDSCNSEVMSGLKPLMIGLVLWAIAGSFGFNTGYAVNPARDLSPRIFTAIAGWGSDVFTCSQCPFSHWWWVPVIAPMIGGAIAAPVYWFFVEANHPSIPCNEKGESGCSNPVTINSEAQL